RLQDQSQDNRKGNKANGNKSQKLSILHHISKPHPCKRYSYNDHRQQCTGIAIISRKSFNFLRQFNLKPVNEKRCDTSDQPRVQIVLPGSFFSFAALFQKHDAKSKNSEIKQEIEDNYIYHRFRPDNCQSNRYSDKSCISENSHKNI